MDISETTDFTNQPLKRGHPTGRDKYITDKLRDEVPKTVNPPIELPAGANEDASNDVQSDGLKFFIPSDKTDFWTNPQVLLCSNLSGHADTLR